MSKVKLLAALTLSILEEKINTEVKGEILSVNLYQNSCKQYIASIVYSEHEIMSAFVKFKDIKLFHEKDGIRLVSDAKLESGEVIQISCGHGGGLFSIDEVIDQLISEYKYEYAFIFTGNKSEIKSSFIN